MTNYKMLISSISMAFLLNACATNEPNYLWYKCLDELPIVNHINVNEEQYEVLACELPKTEAISSFGKYSNFWVMPSGKTCTYKKGPNEHFNKVGSEQEINITRLYGLKKKNMDGDLYFRCEYDIGFLPTKEFGVLEFQSILKSNTSRLFLPEFENGVIRSNALIFRPKPNARKRYNGTVQYSASLINKEGETVKDWKAVEVQTYNVHFYFDQIKQSNMQVHNENFIFDVGENVAFVNNPAKIHEFRTDEFEDPYGGLFVPRLATIVFGSKADMVGKEKSYRERKRIKHNLHLINGKTLSEVKVFSGEEFQIQPMVQGDKDILWNIIGQLEGTQGLYGVLQEDGAFLPPPGSLGIKPVELNTRLSRAENIFEINTGELELRVPRFWLVAFDDHKGGYVWGRASADFTSVSEPIWHDVKFSENGWILAQRLDNKRWMSLDDFNLDFGQTDFASYSEGLTAIEKITNDIKVARKSKRYEEYAAQRKADEVIRAKANIDYAQAKRTGNVHVMRVAVNNNHHLQEDFMLSGYASDEEIDKYIEYFRPSDATKKTLLAKRLDKQRKEQQRLEQIQQQEALDAQNLKELERLQRYANKRKDLEQWRSTVSSNISKTNKTVQEQWGKHQTDMYKKGYIELPK